MSQCYIIVRIRRLGNKNGLITPGCTTSITTRQHRHHVVALRGITWGFPRTNSCYSASSREHRDETNTTSLTSRMWDLSIFFRMHPTKVTDHKREPCFTRCVNHCSLVCQIQCYLMLSDRCIWTDTHSFIGGGWGGTTYVESVHVSAANVQGLTTRD